MEVLAVSRMDQLSIHAFAISCIVSQFHSLMLVMESKDGFVQETAGNDSELESLNQRLNICNTLVDQLEQKMKDVMPFYSSANKKHPNTQEGGSVVGDEYREKLVESSKKRQLIAAHMEITNAKRMQELMHEFGTILHEITQHKCAESFMQPVDVFGLGLHDYYEVVEKPMDFRTIKGKMEAMHGAGYKNVREICADVRLIFHNAMKYYKEGDDLHVMAKTLIDIFETRWLEFLPKVDEEEQRQKEEDTKMQQYIYLAEEVAHAKMAIDLALEMNEVKMLLNELRDTLYKKSRKIIEEKERLGDAIAMSYEAIEKLNELIASNDPNFQGTGETVEIDLGAQSASTLWKSKFLVENRLQGQTSSPSSGGDDKEGNNLNNNDTGKQETFDDMTKD